MGKEEWGKWDMSWDKSSERGQKKGLASGWGGGDFSRGNSILAAEKQGMNVWVVTGSTSKKERNKIPLKRS